MPVCYRYGQVSSESIRWKCQARGGVGGGERVGGGQCERDRVMDIVLRER